MYICKYIVREKYTKSIHTNFPQVFLPLFILFFRECFDITNRYLLTFKVCECLDWPLLSIGILIIWLCRAVIPMIWCLPGTINSLDRKLYIHTNHTIMVYDVSTPYRFAEHINFIRYNYMMTPSNGNIFRVTGPLCGEFTGPRGIPCTKGSDAELWYFLSSVPD